MSWVTCNRCWCTPCQCNTSLGTITFPSNPLPAITYASAKLCYDNYHFFACKHELKCACGQVKRVIEPEAQK